MVEFPFLVVTLGDNALISTFMVNFLSPLGNFKNSYNLHQICYVDCVCVFGDFLSSVLDVFQLPYKKLVVTMQTDCLPPTLSVCCFVFVQ